MFLRFIALALGMTIAAAYAASPADAKLAAVYAAMLDEFSNRTVTNTERYARLEKHYRASENVLADTLVASDDNLRAAYSMSEAMLIAELGYSKPLPQRYVSDMDVLFKELARRGLASAKQRKSIVGAHLSIWQIEEAKALAAHGAEVKGHDILALERVGAFDENAPAVVVLTGKDRIARALPFEFQKGATIVVSAGCNVARRAAEAVSTDDQLKAAFGRASVLWLSPATVSLDTVALDEWNKRFPAAKMHIAFDNAKWQGVDFSRLPSFHFYRDGKLVMRVNGWSDDAAARERIWAGLASIGIHPAPAPARAGSVGLQPTLRSDSGRSKAEPTVR